MKAVNVQVYTNSTFGMSSYEFDLLYSKSGPPQEKLLATFTAFSHADAIAVSMKLAEATRQDISFSLDQNGYGYSYETDGEQVELTGKWKPVERSEKSYFYGGMYE